MKRHPAPLHRHPVHPVYGRRVTERDLELMFYPDTLDAMRERLLDAVADEIRRQDKEDEDR